MLENWRQANWLAYRENELTSKSEREKERMGRGQLEKGRKAYKREKRKRKVVSSG